MCWLADRSLSLKSQWHNNCWQWSVIAQIISCCSCLLTSSGNPKDTAAMQKQQRNNASDWQIATSIRDVGERQREVSSAAVIRKIKQRNDASDLRITTGIRDVGQGEVSSAADGWHLTTHLLRHRVQHVHQQQSEPLVQHLTNDAEHRLNRSAHTSHTTLSRFH